MPQLHFYVPEQVAAAIRARAKADGKTVSGFLAEIVRLGVAGEWPPDFFRDVVGGWKGRPLTRPRQGRPERRARF